MNGIQSTSTNNIQLAPEGAAAKAGKTEPTLNFWEMLGSLFMPNEKTPEVSEAQQEDLQTDVPFEAEEGELSEEAGKVGFFADEGTSAFHNALTDSAVDPLAASQTVNNTSDTQNVINPMKDVAEKSNLQNTPGDEHLISGKEMGAKAADTSVTGDQSGSDMTDGDFAEIFREGQRAGVDQQSRKTGGVVTKSEDLLKNYKPNSADADRIKKDESALVNRLNNELTENTGQAKEKAAPLKNLFGEVSFLSSGVAGSMAQQNDQFEREQNRGNNKRQTDGLEGLLKDNGKVSDSVKTELGATKTVAKNEKAYAAEMTEKIKTMISQTKHNSISFKMDDAEMGSLNFRISKVNGKVRMNINTEAEVANNFINKNMDGIRSAIEGIDEDLERIMHNGKEVQLI